MDFIKAQNILNKINNLFQSIQMTDNTISALERDLMKSYIRELYEQVAIAGIEQEEAPSPPKVVEPIMIPKISENLTDQTSSFDSKLDETIEQVKEEIEPIPEINIPERTDPVAVNGNLKVEEHLNSISTQELPKEVEVEKTIVENIKPVQSSVFNLNPEMEELFAEPKVTELSDRLSGLPINDLGRAFGVNERILTINELFGGDSHLFNNAIKSINDMSDFEDAKKYLVSHVANSMNWTDEGKKKKASVFIKTVRRKFR